MSDQAVTWEEPALFDAPVTHMPVPLALRVVIAFDGHRDLPQRVMWVPFRPSPDEIEELLTLTEDGRMDAVKDRLHETASEWLPGTHLALGEAVRIVNALARNRMMPIPGGAR